jgi:hypothetical protein
MKKLLITIGLAFALSVPTLAKAQDNKSPEVMIEEGVNMVLGALELMLKAIPQYEAPEVLQNGDIIIRRVVPDKEEPKDKKPDYDKT